MPENAASGMTYDGTTAEARVVRCRLGYTINVQEHLLGYASAAIFDLEPPSPEPWEMPDADVECCASGQCEVCAPGGFGGSRYW